MNKDIKQSHDPSRRDFFTTVALASLAPFVPLSIVSCGDDLPTFVGTGKAPFKVWEEMIQAVMTSPDYLPGRMERLIASKDLQAMYHFVRDEIILVPNRPKSIWGMGREMKWGLEGVMRCGMATPREKAELLNKMYLEAGIQSKVVFEKTDFTIEEVPALFLRAVERDFAPKISKKQLRNWKKEMGDSTERFAGKEIKKDFREENKEIGQKAIGALNNDGDWGDDFDFRWDNGRNPTVEFEQDGVVKYAHLFDPNTTFGTLRNPKLRVRKATPPIENEEKIDLKISVRNSIAHKEEVEIIAGEWKASDLVGKQLALQFLHGLTPEEQMVTTVNQLRTFTPVIGLQGGDSENKFLEENSVVGEPFTMQGRKLRIESTKENPSFQDRYLKKPDPALQKQVTSLSLEAVASSFPIVKLNIDAKDQEGEMVEGLSPSDFIITEDGKPVKAIMENNQRTPKILVLSDTSGSMPVEWRGEGVKTFNENLKNGILDNFPAAIVEFWQTPSSLFTWLLKASRTDFDLIVYATDGDNIDTYNEVNFDQYNSGPPALILSVSEGIGV